ncbi:MAG: aminotransferase class I/II-fold pyridoxal phosphate-dependent enzyme [Elusimicrobiota bacterium]|nr:aminotransferase class I/II-fold pyridoxal phosphate-dependent enzyme [Elusimicrobiota bacterium]
MRRIPPAGINLFQLIYVLIDEYKKSSGLEPLNLSLGNPDGVPPEAIRRLKARFAQDPGYDYHTYAESRDLHGFARAMVRLHGGIDPAEHAHLAALPTAGIKTASALVPLACGLHLPDRARRGSFRVASNLPAYDVIGTWTDSYLAAKRVVWPLVSADNMRLSVDRLKEALKREGTDRADLVFVIRPGNPAAVGASVADWKELIAFCLEKGMRLVNDAAYAGLCAPGTHASLASVAKDYPDLEWLELYSVSKSYNDPGARLGALVGSKDFVEDFQLVKGNTDSGPVPGVMAAYGEFLNDAVAASAALRDIRELYEKRLAFVIPKLKAAGLRPACATEAGFFTLWKTPESVLGAKLPAEGRHEAFNRAVITATGLVGVHFSAQDEAGRPEPLIRYAVCADVLEKKFQERFDEALSRLKPAY